MKTWVRLKARSWTSISISILLAADIIAIIGLFVGFFWFFVLFFVGLSFPF